MPKFRCPDKVMLVCLDMIWDNCVVVTSQCLNGRTNLNVYNTGRDMLAAGAITVWDMLPETAYTKLMWALANTSSVEAAKVVMQTPLAGEMSDRRELL